MPLDDLFEEATRQLNVCNACRYCAGYCPVWPALELRTELTRADITHLANLCHDCRDCFTACMYTEPHEFALNPPQVFTAVREDTYRRYVWPQRVPSLLRGRRGQVIGLVVSVLVLLGLVEATSGLGGLFAVTDGSAYAVIAHGLLVAVAALPALWAVGVLLVACGRYWRDTHGSLSGLGHVGAWAATLRQAAVLRHQTGGAEGCGYETEQASPKRRRLHHLVSYGFLLMFVSTTSAAFMENVLGLLPPYPYLSVPVISGTVGGVMASVGCVGLLRAKSRADAQQTTKSMLRADRGFLVALAFLSMSGLAVLALRTTSLFGIVLVAHLAAVILCFAIAPYTKFVHWIYRLLAIYLDNLERARASSAHAAA